MNSKTFNTKIVALALLVATATGIALFPTCKKHRQPRPPRWCQCTKPSH